MTTTRTGAFAAAPADLARRLGRLATAQLRGALTIHGTGYAERIVERALKIQIGLLVLFAAVAPFGGMALEPSHAPLLLGQAALTALALARVRRRDPILGGGLYAILAAVTYVEAKRYTGLVGAVFAFEAVLALIALWYIVVLLRRRFAAGAPA